MRAKVDGNQKEITRFLRECGCSVFPTHMVKNGFPDLVVGFKGVNYLLELKDGSKIKCPLTPKEWNFHLTWKGRHEVIYSIEDAVKWIKSI